MRQNGENDHFLFEINNTAYFQLSKFGLMWRSINAGILAATAASTLKLATNGEFEQILTFTLYGIFIFCNVMMWYLQLNGMSESKTTVSPILLFTSSNFIATGVFGWAFHRETHDKPWFFGLILLLIGTFIVQSSVKSKSE